MPPGDTAVPMLDVRCRSGRELDGIPTRNEPIPATARRLRKGVAGSRAKPTHKRTPYLQFVGGVAQLPKQAKISMNTLPLLR